jgi:hypothetical protein
MSAHDIHPPTVDSVVADIVAGSDLRQTGLPLQFDDASEAALLRELLRQDTPVLSSGGSAHGP